MFRSQTLPSETAAILIEPVLGEGGFVPAPPRFLSELRRIRDEHGILLGDSRRIGAHLMDGRNSLQERFPILADVRGRGLMVACELVDQGQPPTELVKAIEQKCLAAGLMLLSCGTYSNVIRWLPPLVVSAEQIDEAVNIFESAL